MNGISKGSTVEPAALVHLSLTLLERGDVHVASITMAVWEETRGVPNPMYGRGKREITPAAEEFPLLSSV